MTYLEFLILFTEVLEHNLLPSLLLHRIMCENPAAVMFVCGNTTTYNLLYVKYNKNWIIVDRIHVTAK